MPKYKYTVQQLEHMEMIRMTDRQRNIFDMYFWRGLHIEDIAAELDVSRNTIDRELREIRQKNDKQIKLV